MKDVAIFDEQADGVLSVDLRHVLRVLGEKTKEFQ